MCTRAGGRIKKSKRPAIRPHHKKKDGQRPPGRMAVWPYGRNVDRMAVCSGMLLSPLPAHHCSAGLDAIFGTGTEDEEGEEKEEEEKDEEGPDSCEVADPPSSSSSKPVRSSEVADPPSSSSPKYVLSTSFLSMFLL